MSAIAMGGASAAVAASSHAACARFRGTDPLITKRTRRQLAGELGHPDTSGRIPEARWMRAMVFERLVRDDRFSSRVATTTVGRLHLPRPDSVVVADARRDRSTTLDLLGRAFAVATAANKATLIYAPAAAYPGFEDAAATDVLPDFVVVAPRADVPHRAWLVVGDAKDYERIRSRIDDARLLKGFLQVAFGAEAFDQWSERPAGLDVHQFGVLAVPKNAFLQPMAVVEDITDHRDEVRTRLAERRLEALGAEWAPTGVPAAEARAILVDLLEASRGTVVARSALMARRFGGATIVGQDTLDDLAASGLIKTADAGYLLAAEMLRTDRDLWPFLAAPEFRVAGEPSAEHSDAAAEVFRAENQLRELVGDAFRQVDETWWPSRFPAAIVREVETRRRGEAESAAPMEEATHPISYLTLGELIDAVMEDTNWEQIFRVRFATSKHEFSNTLAMLGAVRNKVAHNRHVTVRDLVVLRIAVDRMSRYL